MAQSYLNVTFRSTTLPVALADLKAHLNIIGTNDDARLTALEWSAVDFIERQLNRYLVTTNVTEIFSYFPAWYNRQGSNGYNYQIPYLPILNTPTGLPWQWGMLQRIELSRSPVHPDTPTPSVQYYDVNNILQTLVAGTDYYIVNPTDRPAFIQPVSVWPIAYYRPDAVQIIYSAGYNSGYVPLPYALAAAIKLLCGAWNENREDFNASANMIPSIPIGVMALLDSCATGGFH